jgi:hypothetical protein
MIDTISLRHPVPLLPPSEMAERGFIPKCGHLPSICDHQKWTLNPPKDFDETRPRLTWISSPKGDWLTAEVSLPKFLFNNNVVQLTDADITDGLDGMSRFVQGITHVSFDAYSALVGRVDYCCNFVVGEANKMAYLSAVARASIPRMGRHQRDTSLAFLHGSQKILLYGKHDEVAQRANKGRATDDELHESIGLLRLEISHYTSDACRRLSKKYDQPNRHAELLLHSNIAYQEIERGLKMLGLDKITETVDARVDMLREFYGDTPLTRRLVAFVGFLDRYGEGFWKQGICNYSRSTYFQYCHDLKAAGVWLKSDRQLPSLRLVRTAPKASARAVQPMSNTVNLSPAATDSRSKLEIWNARVDNGDVQPRRVQVS